MARLRDALRRAGVQGRLCVLGGGLALLCAPTVSAAAPAGPRTETVDLVRYAAVRHVDGTQGSDASGDGSAAHPWATLTRALELAAPPGQRVAVLVTQGQYREPTFRLKSGVDLFGGFSTPGGPRDIAKFATILDGDDAQRIALGADDTRIDGFRFAHGRVQGKGAALLCDGVGPVVTNCVFESNRTRMPRDWEPPQLHLTANDGGAVMCLNGATPHFEHCLFFNNTTECGRGGALAADHGARPVIVACVFANNRAGIDDPMRSSDGGALSFFDHCAGELADNVIVGNSSLTRNDAGGVFVALWSAPRIAGNAIVGNDGGDDAGGLFVGGQEHRYGVPLDPYPAAAQYNVAIERNLFVGNDNGSHNSGAMRITMETRARLADNVIAENTGGMYLQRSEIVAEHNTVWQDWRFLEDKPSLGPSRFADNVLRGPVDHPGQARVTFAHNMAEPAIGGTALVAVDDIFLTDGATGQIASLKFDRASATTTVVCRDALPPAAYAGRPILFGPRRSGHWLVVKAANDRTLVCWGRLEAETHAPQQFEILRTFSPKPGAPANLGARRAPSAQ